MTDISEISYNFGEFTTDKENVLENEFTKEEEKKVFCEKCGMRVEEDAKFCPHCGTSLEAENINKNDVKTFLLGTQEEQARQEEMLKMQGEREEQEKFQQQEQETQQTSYQQQQYQHTNQSYYQNAQPVGQNYGAIGSDGKDYTPISMWGYFGYNILFWIPFIGFILVLVFALGGTKNINLRNYARSQFCSLILAVILFLFVAGGIGGSILF